MAIKKIGKMSSTKATNILTEAFVDGDTLKEYTALSKKLGLTTLGDLVRLGELFSDAKDISLTDAIKKYCEFNGMKVQNAEAAATVNESVQPLTEEETFLDFEDIMDAYWVFTTYLEQEGYSNKDRKATIADELSKPKYAEKKKKALEQYRLEVSKAAGDDTKIKKAKEKYLAALREVTYSAAKAIHWIGYWDNKTKDSTCSVSVHAFNKDNLKVALDLAAEVDMYASEIYETRIDDKLGGVLYSVDFDPESVDTQTPEWVDWVKLHAPEGQVAAYDYVRGTYDRATRTGVSRKGGNRWDKAKAKIADANARYEKGRQQALDTYQAEVAAAKEEPDEEERKKKLQAAETNYNNFIQSTMLPRHHETSNAETRAIRKKFDQLKADKAARDEPITPQDYFDSKNNKVAASEITATGYPEDDFSWGDDKKDDKK